MHTKVKHETRKRSSTRWMGCKFNKIKEDRGSWNSKLREEFDDEDLEDYDDPIEDFDFENVKPSKPSKASSLEIFNIKFTLLIASFALRIFL